MFEAVNVYIDESGDASLNVEKGGVSGCYALTAIIVPTSDVDRIASELDAMSQGDEIKSSQLRNKRRAMWIEKISKLDFSFHVLIVNKSRINSSQGMRYKKSFVKYFTRRLYSRLSRIHNVVNFFADEQGSKEFMYELKRYYQKRIKEPIFEYFNFPGTNKMNFEFVNSKDVRLIQLADLVCGSARRVVEGKDDKKILDPLKDKKIAFEVFPPNSNIEISADDSDYDNLVKCVSYDAVSKFIDENFFSDLNDDEMKMLETCVLTFLRDKYNEDPDLFHSANEMRDFLRDIEGFNVLETKFKQIVSNIRKAGVPIASSDKGYKIPNTVDDIYGFVNKVRSTVDPYVQRLSDVRKLFIQASMGKWDIINYSGDVALKQYLERREEIKGDIFCTEVIGDEME